MAKYEIIGIGKGIEHRWPTNRAIAPPLMASWAGRRGLQFVTREFPQCGGWRFIDTRSVYEFRVDNRRFWRGWKLDTRVYPSADAALMAATYIAIRG